MLNFRLLNILISPRSIRTCLGIISTLGAVVLLDILLFLKLALIIGPWITMTALAANTAAGVFIMYYLAGQRNRHLIDSIDSGRYDSAVFFHYISSLVASLFIITPGLLNTILGIIILLPPVSNKVGKSIAETMGVDWQEAHEFLRLERVAGSRSENSADS